MVPWVAMSPLVARVNSQKALLGGRPWGRALGAGVESGAQTGDSWHCGCAGMVPACVRSVHDSWVCRLVMTHEELTFHSTSLSWGWKVVKMLRRVRFGGPKWHPKVDSGPGRRRMEVMPMVPWIAMHPPMARVNSQKALLGGLTVGTRIWSRCGIWC